MKSISFSKFINSEFKKIFFESDDINIITENIIELYKKKPQEFNDNIDNADFFLNICMNLSFTYLQNNKHLFFFKNKNTMNITEANVMEDFIEKNKKTSNNALNSHFLKTNFGMFKKVFLNNLFHTPKDYFNIPLIFKIASIPNFNPFTLNIIDYNRNNSEFVRNINDRNTIITKGFLTKKSLQNNINFYNNLFLINPQVYLELVKNNNPFKLNSVNNENPLFYFESFDNPFFNKLDIKKCELARNKSGLSCIEKIVYNDMPSKHNNAIYYSLKTYDNLKLLSVIEDENYNDHNILLNSLKATLAVNQEVMEPHIFEAYLSSINLEELVYIPVFAQQKLVRNTKNFEPIHPFQLFQKNQGNIKKYVSILKNINQDELYSKDIFTYLIHNEFLQRDLSKYLVSDKYKNKKLSDEEILSIFEEGIKYKNLTSLYTLELIYNRNPKLDMKLSLLKDSQKMLALEACLSVFRNINDYPDYFFKKQFYIARAFMHLFSNENLNKHIKWNADNIISVINYYESQDIIIKPEDFLFNEHLLKNIDIENKNLVLEHFLQKGHTNKAIIVSILENSLLKEKFSNVYPQLENINKKRI